MPCLNPVHIKVNGKEMDVPCGRCYFCRLNRANDWVTRLKIHFKSGLSLFVTLTYDDYNLPRVIPYNGLICSEKINPLLLYLNEAYPTAVKKDLQKFFKRLRKSETFSYYAISEYGPKTLRPHYHMLVNFPCRNQQDLPLLETKLKEVWHLGYVECSQITDGRIKYVTFYASKSASYVRDYLDKCEYIQPPFSLMSKRMGIDFVRKNFDFIRSHNYLYDIDTGKKIHVPRYFRKKVLENLDAYETEQMQKVYDPSDSIESNHYELYCRWMLNNQRQPKSYEQYKDYDDRDYCSFISSQYEQLDFNNDKLGKKLNKKSKI